MSGQVGVAVFFMITGYLFWSMLIREAGRPSWWSLYIGRFCRIAPLFMLAIAFMVAVVAIRMEGRLRVPWRQLAAELGRWSSLGMLGGRSLNGNDDAGQILAGVTWTLQYEWIFYTALILLAPGVRRRRFVLPFTGASFALALIWWMMKAPLWLSDLDPIAALLFGTGMMGAALEANGWILRVADRALSTAVLALTVLVFVLFPSAYGLLPVVTFGAHDHRHRSYRPARPWPLSKNRSLA